jgi:hypothetical protein
LNQDISRRTSTRELGWRGSRPASSSFASRISSRYSAAIAAPGTSIVEQDWRRSSRIHCEKILPSLPGPLLDQPDFALVLGERQAARTGNADKAGDEIASA